MFYRGETPDTYIYYIQMEENIMAFSIKIKELGMTKPVEVKVSNKVLKSTLKLQNEIASSQEKIANGEVDVVFATMIDLIDIKKEFIKEVLRLTDTQADKFDELTVEEGDDIVAEITSKVLGLDEIQEESDEEGKD